MRTLFCCGLTAGLIISIFFQSPAALICGFLLTVQLVGIIGDPDGHREDVSNNY